MGKIGKQFNRQCSLFVILARETDKAVIFRRGPSKWVRLITWDTTHDTFEFGQWFHGRIFARRSDLSPSGDKLIYFAQKINSRTLQDKEYTYSWTAISKPPYFTALALWPKGDSWNGGGLFMNKDMIHLNSPAVPHNDHLPPQNLKIIPNAFATGEDAPIYYKRLARDGWVVVQNAVQSKTDYFAFQQTYIWRKNNADGAHRLMMELTAYVPGKPGGGHNFKFWIEPENSSVRISVDADQWAEWDRQGRLVYVKEGKLFAAQVTQSAIEPVLLADFTQQTPEPVFTPEWAKKWTV